MLGRKKTQLSFTDIDVLQAWEQKPIGDIEACPLTC